MKSMNIGMDEEGLMKKVTTLGKQMSENSDSVERVMELKKELEEL